MSAVEAGENSGAGSGAKDGEAHQPNGRNEELHTIAAKLIETARKHSVSIGAAESCSGGMAASALTSVPGCSDVFWGCVVSYANEAKVALLGVDEAVLSSVGAVDKNVALQMASGACKALDVDFAFSTTGIAGPDGGSEHKPVGTVWVAVAGKGLQQATLYHFTGTREQIRQATAKQALHNLTDFIQISFG